MYIFIQIYMADECDFKLNLDSVLKRYELVQQRDYQIACIKDAVEGINCGKDVLINLPTGTGKTMIYSPIVAEIAENTQSVLVLTATKQAQRSVSSEITKFNSKTQPSVVYGITEFH